MQDGRIAIGRRIKRLREKKGLSRQHVADALKVDLTAAAAWEAGKYLPREGRRLRLAELLQVDVGTLFAEEQEPSPSRGAALVDVQSELPGLLRELISSAERTLRAFRLASRHATLPFVQEEFRRLTDKRILDGSLEVERIEIFYELERLKEVLATMLRYAGRPFRVRTVCNGVKELVPGMGGYLFDDREFLLGGYWSEYAGDGRPGLRLSGEPYRTYFADYWREIWDRARPLNPDGAADLDGVRSEAVKLGLDPGDWPRFLSEAESLTLDDGLPPLI
ncbi:MAG: helix-turn-helix transcriptional regulator [Alphaproteobacteria bacterium]|nr:helix-turn-helix transcriptional regulator [Alphaproteobacteria bacterium]